MIRQLRFVLLFVAVAIVAASVWALLSYRADSQRRERDTHDALRTTAEFLKPDTTSDIRFGKPQATPTPPAP